MNVIACPTCGRVEIDVVRMANELEQRLGHIRTPLTVSVLGCVVNGIGEGKEADIGIAGGQGVGILFKKGQLVRKVPSEKLMETLVHEVEVLAKEMEAEKEIASHTASETIRTVPERSHHSGSTGRDSSHSSKVIPVLPTAS